MHAEKLHVELLALGEEIARIKASRAPLVAQIAELDEQLAALVERHRSLLSGSGKALTNHVASEQAQGASWVVRKKGKRPGRAPSQVLRILALLDGGQVLTAEQIATKLGMATKTVYMALQDMKRRRHLVDGPNAGVWAIAHAGHEEIARRRGKEGKAA